MDAVAASSLETYSRVPSGLRANCSGSEPPGIVRTMVRVMTSIWATPSFCLLTGSFAQSASDIVGGQRGEPERATYTKRPSGLTCTPRTRAPSGIVASTESLAVAITVRSWETSFETYASSPTGAAAAAEAAVAAGGGALPRPQARAPRAVNAMVMDLECIAGNMVSGVGCRVSGVRCQVSGVRDDKLTLAPGTWHLRNRRRTPSRLATTGIRAGRKTGVPCRGS